MFRARSLHDAVFGVVADFRASGDPEALRMIASALDAMGGAGRIGAIKTIHLEAKGRRNALEQSERPEGPWIPEYQTVVEDRDVANGRLARTTASAFATYEWSQTIVVSGGVVAAKSGGRVSPYPPGADEWLALAPERLFSTAQTATDLAVAPDCFVQGVAHRVLAFTWHGHPVRVYLNASTLLPSIVETTRPLAYDYFSVWGDVTTRTAYSLWLLGSDGIRYPMQWDVEQNGTPSWSLSFTKVSFDAAIGSDAFAIPDDVSAAFKTRASAAPGDVPLGGPDRPATEVVPGVIQIQGGFNVAIVKQDDGLVILEAPVSSAYSAKVIDEALRRYPDAVVKGVITTSDAWPHLGGVREYVSRGVPVFALDVNRPILERLLAAPFATYPDALARRQRNADFRIVSSPTTIGSGANRMVLYPIRSEAGERQMMVYFPEHRLLYASDLAQPEQSGAWIVEYYDELKHAAARERIQVETVFAMHMSPTPWQKLISVLPTSEP